MRFELATGNNFPERKIAFHALEFLVILVNFAAAFRARHKDRAKIAGDRVVLEILGLTDDVLGHVDNFGHEFLAFQLAFFHQRELFLPVGGEFRRIQFRYPQTVQRDHERGGFGGGN